MKEQTKPGEKHYIIDAELKGEEQVRYGTTFIPEQGVTVTSDATVVCE